MRTGRTTSSLASAASFALLFSSATPVTAQRSYALAMLLQTEPCIVPAPQSCAISPIWASDTGALYAGPGVPSPVVTRRDFYWQWDGASFNDNTVHPTGTAPSGYDGFPDGTVMALNNATGANEAVIIAQQDALDKGWLKYFNLHEFYLTPWTEDGDFDWDYYLVDTDVEGTYAVTWRNREWEGEPVGMRAAMITQWYEE